MPLPNAESRDRRHGDRLVVSHVRLVYGRRPRLAFLPSHKRSVPCPVVDVSRQGLRFLTDEDLRPGQRLKVALRLEHDAPSVRFDATVVWVQPAGRSHEHAVGLCSTEYQGNSWRSLWDFVETHSKDKDAARRTAERQ